MAEKGGITRERKWRQRLRLALSGMRRFRVKTWILVLALVPLGFVDATLLRLDHVKMTELRDAVLEVDAKITDDESEEAAQANDAKIREALIELKEFTFSHIVVNVVEENGVQRATFGTGPFYLEHQYHRSASKVLQEAEAKLASDENPYGNVYGAAGETCRAEAIANGWTWSSPEFIDCMLTEIQKYPAAADIQDTIIASLPSTELFRHNYASPVWAPTPAGFLLLITAVVLIILAIRLIYWIVIRIALVFV